MFSRWTTLLLRFRLLLRSCVLLRPFRWTTNTLAVWLLFRRLCSTLRLRSRRSRWSLLLCTLLLRLLLRLSGSLLLGLSRALLLRLSRPLLLRLLLLRPLLRLWSRSTLPLRRRSRCWLRLRLLSRSTSSAFHVWSCYRTRRRLRLWLLHRSASPTLLFRTRYSFTLRLNRSRRTLSLWLLLCWLRHALALRRLLLLRTFASTTTALRLRRLRCWCTRNWLPIRRSSAFSRLSVSIRPCILTGPRTRLGLSIHNWRRICRLRCTTSLAFISYLKLLTLCSIRNFFDAHGACEITPERRRNRRSARHHCRVLKLLRDSRRNVLLTATPR